LRSIAEELFATVGAVVGELRRTYLYAGRVELVGYDGA
jgi:hypothetical protein